MANAARPFTLEVATSPMWVEGVPDAFAQLLDKLVENADDFAPAGSPIAVSLERIGRVARLAVANTGPPIPEEARQRLFASMVSLREGQGSEPGHLGLGLYIVRLVAERHGGAARAENQPRGAGVRFEVEVPLLRSSQRGALALP